MVNSVCCCLFKGRGLPMDNGACPVHRQYSYKCDECRCDNYRPMAEPRPSKDGKVWSNCACGHSAQSHN